MSTNPFTRVTPPDAFQLKVTPGGSDGRATIENSHKRLADFDHEYVSFGGYFGIHGPELFAAAPDLLAALIELADNIGAASLARNPYGKELRAKAAAAIARATPTAEGVA